MSYDKRRWLALFAGILIEMCSGITYAWSVFQTPLIEKYACSTQMVTMLYTSNFWVSAFAFLFIGPFMKKHLTIRKEVLLGSSVYVASLLLTSCIQSSFALVVLIFGVLRCLGTALVYPVLMSYAVELFPERSGLSSGLMAAGFGLGAMIWAPLATSIHQATGDISRVFLTFGIIFGVVMIPLSFLLVPPPTPGQLPQGVGTAPARRKKAVALYQVNRLEMIRLPLFYITFIGLVFALACGNLVVNQASPIMRNLFGVSAQSAALLVSACSIFNVLGRLVCGVLSDRIGRSQVGFLALCVTAVMMLGMAVCRQNMVFTVFMLLVVFCYGGLASMVSPLTREVFGSTHFTANYSVLYFAYAIGSVVGPMGGNLLLTKTGSYGVEFGYAAVLAALGGAAMFLIAKKIRAAQIRSVRQTETNSQHT